MKNLTQISVETIPTPAHFRGGDFTIATRNGAVCAAEFKCDRGRIERLLTPRFGGLRLAAGDGESDAARAVRRYFDGDLQALQHIQVDQAGTPFQMRVWAALRAIPVGQTRSYGDIAAAIDAPRAFRAVGLANNRNPVALIVPCHRVIGADGGLTGYAGGLELKERLLAHEGFKYGQYIINFCKRY